MRKRGLTLVEIMVSIAIISLLTVIIISSILSHKVIYNESQAQDTLRNISRGYDLYAAKHNGSYNETVKNLADRSLYKPPYLKIDYTAEAYNGYIFSCVANNAGYICSAKPEVLKETGTKSFTICTGGILKEASGETAPPCPANAGGK